MNGRELIGQLNLVEIDKRVFAQQLVLLLARNIHDATLKSGKPLTDRIDFEMFLSEVADAAAPHVPHVPPQARWSRREEATDQTCPRCGHIHQGSAECGIDIGGGRICRCELAVAV